MKKMPPILLRDAIKLVTDFKDDLSGAPPVGFHLSQDDCWACAAALVEVLSSHNAFMEERLAWQETREGMNR